MQAVKTTPHIKLGKEATLSPGTLKLHRKYHVAFSLGLGGFASKKVDFFHSRT
jgi:hypothetical protein